VSGIVGIFYLDGRPVQAASVEGMLEKLIHRGPDGKGIWCSGSVGMGHCMLWTTPESLEERQPMLTSHSELVLVSDARIDNRDELLKALPQGLGKKSEINDGQLILHAYQEWNQECVNKLEGDFAFAIWDAREHLFFCARDAIGVKPFYYFHSPTLFVFASEIKALLSLPDVLQKLNEIRIAEYFLEPYADQEATFYKEIKRLPPAHFLSVDKKSKRKTRYWSLNYQHEIHFKDKAEYVQAFKQLFSDAVNCRVRSAYPIGSMLSGGLDSSFVASTARELLRPSTSKPLKVFSVIYHDPSERDRASYDEFDYISRVLALGGFKSCFIRGDCLSPFGDFKEETINLDEPYLAPTFYLYRALHQSAQITNVRVMLDGTDGDRTVYNGLDYLTDLAKTGRWIRWFHESKQLAEQQYSNLSTSRVLWYFGVKPLLPSRFYAFRRWLSGNSGEVDYITRLVRPDFLKRVGFTDKYLLGIENKYKKKLREIHYEKLTSGQIPWELELLDKSCAVSSIEGRYPFYDRRLLEFCLSLPAEMLLSQGWSRYILRVAMDGLFPGEVEWRKAKANLGNAFSTQLYQLDKSRLQAQIIDSKSNLAEYINLDVYQAAFNAFISDPKLHIHEASLVYRVITLSKWLTSGGIN
jgi:asparagine synthase (glutamine-hydrolysing)